MEACLKEELPSASELEEALRNGVILAKLAIFFHPEGLKEKNVYDYDQEIFKACFVFWEGDRVCRCLLHSSKPGLSIMQERKLVFRHTDNSAQWLRCMREMKFPEVWQNVSHVLTSSPQIAQLCSPSPLSLDLLPRGH